MKKIKSRSLKLDSWVKVSIIMQTIIAVLVGFFTYFQFHINREMEKRYVLEKSFSIKNSLADLMFRDDKIKNEAKMRNIFEWLQEDLE